MSTVARGNLVTVAEAAGILSDRGIHRSVATVKYWAQKGYLRADKIGNAWMIDRDCLVDFEPPERGNPEFGPSFHEKKLASCS